MMYGGLQYQLQQDALGCVEQLPAEVSAVVLTWFHGMRARIRAIPQVSVIPANIRPAPTKADSPAKPG